MHSNGILQHLIFFLLRIKILPIKTKIGLAIVAIRFSKISVHNIPFQRFIKFILVSISKNNNTEFLFGHQGDTGHKAVDSTCMRNDLSSAVFLEKPAKTIKRKMTLVKK